MILPKRRMLKTLWHAYGCQSEIIISSDRVHSYYCKTRFCTVCLANRKAIQIRNYLPVIEKWKSPQFLTLTVKSVPAKHLKKRMDNMQKGLSGIIANHRKKHARGTGIKLLGVKSMECEFNATNPGRLWRCVFPAKLPEINFTP